MPSARQRCMASRVPGPTGRGRCDEDSVGTVEPGGFADLVDSRRGRVARRGELALDDPELAVLHAENIGPTVATAADQADVIEPVTDEKARDVALEGLPRSLQKPAGVEEWLAHFTGPRRISAGAASKRSG